MTILGIGYTARVGKDTIADYLVKNYGFVKISFADSLKRACKEIFNLSDEQVYGNLKETIDPFWQKTPRYILQKVGTDCLRNGFDQNIWIKSLRSKLVFGNKYVIPDVRFINEANAVVSWGGKLVKVLRDNAGATGGIASHASEIELNSFDKWDYMVYNDSTFEDLYRKIDNLVKLCDIAEK